MDTSGIVPLICSPGASDQVADQAAHKGSFLLTPVGTAENTVEGRNFTTVVC